MNNKIAFIFPGQGSQSVGMGKDLYNNFDIAKNFYDQADDFFDFSLSSISFNGPENNLKETKYTQPAIFVNSCIISNILQPPFYKAVFLFTFVFNEVFRIQNKSRDKNTIRFSWVS